MATIFRADTIGSLLRPAYLHEVRQSWMKGNLPTHEFKRAEDHAVDEALAQIDAPELATLMNLNAKERMSRAASRYFSSVSAVDWRRRTDSTAAERSKR